MNNAEFKKWVLTLLPEDVFDTNIENKAIEFFVRTLSRMMPKDICTKESICDILRVSFLLTHKQSVELFDFIVSKQFEIPIWHRAALLRCSFDELKNREGEKRYRFVKKVIF